MSAVHKKNSAIMVSSRIRLARNLAHTRFVNAADELLLGKVRKQCADAISKLPKFKGGSFFEIENLTPFQRQMLEERNYASKELADSTAKTGVFISKDESCSAMINEEDHLRIQSFAKGLNLSKIWKLVNSVDDGIEKRLEYAFSSEYGYLTACPTNVGTGMRASVMMQLSALTLSGLMEKIVRGVNQLGMVVRGADGEGSDSFGAYYQISNQQTLGMSELDIIERMTKIAKKIAEFEINARYKLLEERPLFLEDRIERSRAILSSCRLISTAEALGHLADLRMASDMGILESDCVEFIDMIMTEVRPAHLKMKFSLPSNASSDERDAARAKFIKLYISEIPALKPLKRGR